MAQPVLLGFMDAEIREEELGHFSYNKVHTSHCTLHCRIHCTVYRIH